MRGEVIFKVENTNEILDLGITLDGRIQHGLESVFGSYPIYIDNNADHFAKLMGLRDIWLYRQIRENCAFLDVSPYDRIADALDEHPGGLVAFIEDSV